MNENTTVEQESVFQELETIGKRRKAVRKMLIDGIKKGNILNWIYDKETNTFSEKRKDKPKTFANSKEKAKFYEELSKYEDFTD